jgi:threonine dehydrogenase-like Zn-dependent dehydrogenase
VPDTRCEDDALMPSLLMLTNVMCTGHHAAITAGVRPGATAAVVGDGAVGLFGLIAARRCGRSECVGLQESVLTALQIARLA